MSNVACPTAALKSIARPFDRVDVERDRLTGFPDLGSQHSLDECVFMAEDGFKPRSSMAGVASVTRGSVLQE
jgi:hypothetical protein